MKIKLNDIKLELLKLNPILAYALGQALAQTKPMIDLSEILESKKNSFSDDLARFVQGDINADTRFNDIIIKVSALIDVTGYIFDRNSIKVPIAVTIETKNAVPEDLDNIKSKIEKLLDAKESKVSKSNVIIRALYPMIIGS